VPFALNQSAFATTVGDTALGLTPPLPCRDQRVEGHTNSRPPPYTHSIDFASFDENDLTSPFYPMYGGTFSISGYDNTLSTEPELATCLADTEWLSYYSDQEQQSQPSMAAPTTSLPLRRRAIAQKGPVPFGLPNNASHSHLASPSPSTGSVAAHTGSISRANRGQRHCCTQPNCPATFGRGVDFRRHMRTVHQLGGGGLYRCLVGSCDYQNPRSDKVRSHMAEAHNVQMVTA
jgi:hypothetical protein